MCAAIDWGQSDFPFGLSGGRRTAAAKAHSRKRGCVRCTLCVARCTLYAAVARYALRRAKVDGYMKAIAQQRQLVDKLVAQWRSAGLDAVLCRTLA